MREKIQTRRLVPLNKQSKKTRRRYYAGQRGSWRGLCPVTRTTPNRTAYDRNRAKRETRDAYNL